MMVSGNLTMRSLCSVRESSEGLLGLSTSIVGYPIAAGVRRVVGRWSANIDPGSAFGAGAGGLHSTCLDMRFVESSLGDVTKESTFGVSVTDKRVQTFAKSPLSSTCNGRSFSVRQRCMRLGQPFWIFATVVAAHLVARSLSFLVGWLARFTASALLLLR